MPVCCTQCFSDSYLADELSTGVEGSCDFCGSTAPCVGTTTLQDKFARFLDYYAPFEPEKHADFAPLFSRFGPFELPLAHHIQNEWGTFSNLVEKDAQTALIDSILAGDDRFSPDSTWIPPEFSTDRVSFREMWRDLARHLKIERRFVIDSRSNQDLDEVPRLVQDAAEYVSKPIQAQTEYFRSRRGYVTGDSWEDVLSGGQRPYEQEEMGAPPKSATLGGGRLNPPGFNFLYLSSDRDTAVAEIRPAKGDLVSAAVFKTTNVLVVADLTDVPRLESPFEPEDLLEDMETRNLMKLLSYEFAEPVSPDVGQVEYVPTQYAAELFRDAGFAGVVYDSSLGTGTNLVLFDPKNASWVSSHLVKVEDVRYYIKLADAELFRNMFEASAEQQRS